MNEIIVGLENIRSLYNIGAIYRTCEFLGIKKILLIGYSGKDEREPNKIHKKLEKTSLRTIDKIETELYENINEIILAYPEFKLISVEQDENSILINKFKSNSNENKYILIFGNEIDGVEKETLKRSSYILEIPNLGTHKSLNVSTSCGIALAYLQLGTGI